VCLPVLVLACLPADAQAGKLATAIAQHVREVRQNFSTRPRVTRMVVSAGIGALAGISAQAAGTPYPEAVFASYAVSEIVDRSIQRKIASTRSVTPDTRGPLAFAAETVAVSAIAGLSAAMLQHQLEPFTHTLIGRATPGVIGMSAGAVFPRALLRGTLSVGVSLVTNTARAGMYGVLTLQRRLRRTFRKRAH
jgi:hypothetical protein